MHAERDIKQTVGLLGGESTIQFRITDAMDAHDALLQGLPAGALLHLVSTVPFLEQDEVLQRAMGISLRTLQRHKSRRREARQEPQRLSVEQSNRTWRFAEVFGHAIEVMGSKQAAEAWMNQPAIGLANRKPIDLMATSAGLEALDEYLTRLEFGVYT